MNGLILFLYEKMLSAFNTQETLALEARRHRERSNDVSIKMQLVCE